MAENPSPTPELWRALLRVSQLLPRALDEGLAEQGGSLAHCEILTVLADRAEGVRMSELGQLAQVSKPRLSVHVRQLEEEGLLRRRTDPTDGRATLVSISPLGRRRLRKWAPVQQALANSLVLDQVRQRDRATVLRALTAIVVALEES